MEIAGIKLPTIRDLWMWLILNLILVGAMASMTFIRVNYLGKDVELAMPESSDYEIPVVTTKKRR